jgi:hypothetical protein
VQWLNTFDPEGFNDGSDRHKVLLLSRQKASCVLVYD